jgi:DNA-binding CsgD family transcriptional regulator
MISSVCQDTYIRSDLMNVNRPQFDRTCYGLLGRPEWAEIHSTTSTKRSGDAMPVASNPPAAIARLLRQFAFPLLIVDLDRRTFVDANLAAYQLLGRDSDSLKGIPVADVIGDSDLSAVETLMSLLESRALEAYHAVRHLRTGDGREISANLWVRVARVDGRNLALVVAKQGDAKVPWRLTQGRVTIAGMVTDHDWTIEMVSSDIETILGLTPETSKGRPLLGLLQPWDVQNFMSAIGRITTDGGGATLRVHLRNGRGAWQETLLLVVALCKHSPPRLGLAVTNPEPETGAASPSHRDLAARGGDVLGGVDRFQFSTPTGRFSARQSEILTRLLRGEQVQDIAHALCLSPSTVRNHLTAIYRKLGVHSQAELLAKLLRN